LTEFVVFAIVLEEPGPFFEDFFEEDLGGLFPGWVAWLGAVEKESFYFCEVSGRGYEADYFVAGLVCFYYCLVGRSFGVDEEGCE
jgi:hypothetical protein